MSKEFNHIDEVLLWQYFQGDLTQEENSAVEEWKNLSVQNLKQFEDTQKLFELTQVKTEEVNFDADLAWQKVSSKINAPKKDETPVISIEKANPTYKSLYWAAAVFIGLILSVNLINSLFFNVETIQVFAENTSKEVSLPDGTIITLKPNSSISYQSTFNQKTRKVALVGDAYFDVERNEKLPFVIDGTNAQIKVLGTEFLVDQTGGEKTEVIVNEGSVQLSSNEKDEKGEEKKVVLKAGEKGIFNKADKKLIKEINNDPNFIAWKTKILQFDKVNLTEVIKKIEEVYEVKITLKKSEIEQCALTARFDNQTIEQIMQTLSLTLNLQIEKDGKIYQLDGSGC